jgi:hypothetical protein
MPPPVNPLLLQTLALTLSEVNQCPRCTLRIRLDTPAIGAGATLELSWNDGAQSQIVGLLGLTSRDTSADTSGLARDYMQGAADWLTVRGWQIDRQDADQITLKREPVAPVPTLDKTAQTGIAARVAPFLDALRSEQACLVVHEYSYETRGGLALTDEVALRWGKQARLLRSEGGSNPALMETLFPAGEQLAAEVTAHLLEKGWQLVKRERQAQGASTLSNFAATNVTVTFHLQRKKRFGLF